MDIRDRIAEIHIKLIYHGRHFSPKRDEVTLKKANDAILSLEIGGEVEEECRASKTCTVYTCIKDHMTPRQRLDCTGKITRKRLLRDVVGKGEEG